GKAEPFVVRAAVREGRHHPADSHLRLTRLFDADNSANAAHELCHRLPLYHDSSYPSVLSSGEGFPRCCFGVAAPAGTVPRLGISEPERYGRCQHSYLLT